MELATSIFIDDNGFDDRPAVEDQTVQITSGKHAGKTSQLLMLNHPDYAAWYMGEYPDAKLSVTLRQHIAKLDGRPFVTSCQTCGKAATRATAYAGDCELMFWCDRCDPHGAGAIRGKLHGVRTYGDALRHIQYTADGHKGYMKRIVRSLAEAKGLPKRVGEATAQSFLS